MTTFLLRFVSSAAPSPDRPLPLDSALWSFVVDSGQLPRNRFAEQTGFASWGIVGSTKRQNFDIRADPQWSRVEPLKDFFFFHRSCRRWRVSLSETRLFLFSLGSGWVFVRDNEHPRLFVWRPKTKQKNNKKRKRSGSTKIKQKLFYYRSSMVAYGWLHLTATTCPASESTQTFIRRSTSTTKICALLFRFFIFIFLQVLLSSLHYHFTSSLLVFSRWSRTARTVGLMLSATSSKRYLLDYGSVDPLKLNCTVPSCSVCPHPPWVPWARTAGTSEKVL